MTPEEYQKIKGIFQSALEIETSDRTEFLDDACGENPTLRQEVEKLLNNYESGFMEETAIQDFAPQTFGGLSIGEKIGRYEIVSKLGKGGMGEVYLARDKSLSRDVAVKVLLNEVSADRDRVNRFKLEARAASSLNHPNIITIHEIGEDEGKIYIATEHIKGETLRSLIVHKNLDLASAIRIAEQIASALTAAHNAGIIHRDIKPENIMVREDGFVKVLDFGLAKPTTLDTESETKDIVLTKKGLIMGSIGYMSPEQARGHLVDPRTDLWSLGVVFYEMLTGKAPFQAETMTDTLANIIHKEPLPLREQIEAPQELYRIVKKSLRKNVEERYQSAKDLGLDLKNLRREMEIEHELELSVSPDRLQEIRSRSKESLRTDYKEQKQTDEVKQTQPLFEQSETLNNQTIGTSVNKKSRMPFLALAGIILTSVFGYFGYQYLKPKTLLETAFNRTSIEKVPINGNIALAEISPDKRYIAFVQNGKDNQMRLVLRQTETNAEKEIIPMGDVLVNSILFSPDGNYFYYNSSSNDKNFANGIFRVPLLGGDPVQVSESLEGGFSIDNEGKKIVFVRMTQNPLKNELIVLNLETKEEKVLISTPDRYISFGHLSPDGKKIAYISTSSMVSANANLYWISIDGGEEHKFSETVLKQTMDLTWLKDGTGLILSGKLVGQPNSKIYKVSFPAGEFTPITNDTNRYGAISLSADTNYLLSIQNREDRGIWEFDTTSKSARQIISNTNDGKSITDILADNRFVIFKLDQKGIYSLGTMNFDGSNEKLIAETDTSRGVHYAANDGKICYFDTDEDVWRADLQTGKKENLTETIESPSFVVGADWDGKTILINQWDPSVIRLFNPETNQSFPLVESETETLVVSGFDRNGKRFTYHKIDETSPERETKTYLAQIENNKVTKTTVLFDEFVSSSYIFSGDANKIYFRYAKNDNGADLWQKDLLTNKISKLTNFNIDSIFNFIISRDGKKIYISRGNSFADVVLIKNY